MYYIDRQKGEYEMKVTPIIKTKNNKPKSNAKPNIDSSVQNFANNDTCIKCRCKDENDIKKLNEIIHKFNSTQVDINKRALIQCGRQYINNCLYIALTIMSVDNDPTISSSEFESYNSYLYNAFSSAKIDFTFADFETCIKNTADVMSFTEDENDEKIFVIDRHLMPRHVFDYMCQYIIPGVDKDHIAAIRIPYNQITVTSDCKWNMVENNHENEKIDKPSTNMNEDTIKINVCIFNVRNSQLFDTLVRKLSDVCIKRIIAEYEEDENNNYFRTIHLELYNNEYTKLFTTSCENLGSIQPINEV